MVAKVLIFGMFLFGQAAAAPAVKVSDLSWLTGKWAGEGLGGTVEEAWSDAAGGAMVGYFRLLRDGKPVFYEIMTLLEHEGGVEMRLKHVNPDMTGWEEKQGFVTFRLLRSEPNAAYFKGLTFKREGDTLISYLTLRNRADGSVREEKFVYRLVR